MNYRVSEAVVLSKEDLGESDALVHLYSPHLGRITAKVQSAKKITSKLNPHLEPGGLVTVQLVKKNSYQIIDALRESRPEPTATLIKFMDFVKAMTFEGGPEVGLWRLLVAGRPDFRAALKILGFDPSFAKCEGCGGQPDFFLITQNNFWCSRCGNVQWPDLVKF